MLSKKKFLSVVLMCSLALSSFAGMVGAEPDTSTTSISVSDIEKGESFRKAYGFQPNTSKSLLISNNESYQKYGVYLTNEELEILNERDKIIFDARKKQKEIMDAYGSNIGGIYFDHFMNYMPFK